MLCADPIIEESLSLADKEKELIIKALDKHNGKRKKAAAVKRAAKKLSRENARRVRMY